MIAYTRERLLRLIKLDFIRFCIVGGVGFVINFVLLIGLHRFAGLNVFVAQLIAAEIALYSNFMLHHHWTYKAHRINKTLRQLLIQFHLTSWPAILGSATMVTLGEQLLHLNSFSALMLSSAIALMWNFGWSKYVVWQDITQADIESA